MLGTKHSSGAKSFLTKEVTTQTQMLLPHSFLESNSVPQSLTLTEMFQLLQTLLVICEMQTNEYQNADYTETDLNLMMFLAPLLPFSVPQLLYKTSLFFCKHKSAVQASKEEVCKKKKASNCKVPMSLKKVCRKGRLVIGLEIMTPADM